MDQKQICACLPAGRDPMDELELFLSRFSASPDTLAEGYSLAAPRQELTAYERLCALLCQAGLASIRPAGEGRELAALLTQGGFAEVAVKKTGPTAVMALGQRPTKP